MKAAISGRLRGCARMPIMCARAAWHLFEKRIIGYLFHICASSIVIVKSEIAHHLLQSLAVIIVEASEPRRAPE